MIIRKRSGEMTTLLTIVTSAIILVGFVLGNLAINQTSKTTPSAASLTYCGESCSFHVGAPKKASGVTLKCVDKSLVCPNLRSGSDVWWDIDEDNEQGVICNSIRPNYCFGDKSLEGQSCSKNGDCATGLVCDKRANKDVCVKSNSQQTRLILSPSPTTTPTPAATINPSPIPSVTQTPTLSINPSMTVNPSPSAIPTATPSTPLGASPTPLGASPTTKLSPSPTPCRY